MLLQDNFSSILLLNKQNKQILSPWRSWHSSVPSPLILVIFPHSWIRFVTKILILGDLIIHSPCTHQEAWCFWRKSHKWTHRHYHYSRSPTSMFPQYCPIIPISFLWSNLSPFTTVNISNHRCSPCLHPASPPLFFSLFSADSMTSYREKIKASSSCYQATSLSTSTPSLSFSSSCYGSPCYYLRPILHLRFQLHLLSTFKAVYIIHHFVFLNYFSTRFFPLALKHDQVFPILNIKSYFTPHLPLATLLHN